jgi:hypothetical protein
MNVARNQLAEAGFGGGPVDFSRIFPRDASVFLRYDHSGKTVNVAVTCRDVFSKTNVMTIVWPEGEGLPSMTPPHVNDRVECVTMLRGRLMQFPAKISGLHRDARLTMMLALDPKCRIINLRKHERFRVYGWVSLSAKAPAKVEQDRLPMDLSTGGFGAGISEPGLEVGQECPFHMLADVYSSAQHSQGCPSLEISGTALLRRVASDREVQQPNIGAQFSELPAEDERRLREWLVKNQPRLCLV